MPQGLKWEPKQTRHFAGRIAELERLHGCLSVGADVRMPQTVAGLGGVGKTTLALEYARRYKAHYSAILWLEADNPALLDARFREIVRWIGMADAANDETTRQTVLDYLQATAIFTQGKPHLLIYDNVEDCDAVREYLPEPFGGCCLFTSRNPDLLLLTDAEPFLLDEFTPDEAHEFFQKFLGNRLPADFHAPDPYNAGRTLGAVLAEELGHLPLALEQAAAYLHQFRAASFATYLREFRDKRLAYLERQMPLFYRRDAARERFLTVLTTWQINFARLEGTAAAEILRYCAFFAPDGIPKDIFVRNPDVFGEPLAQTLRDAGDDAMMWEEILVPAINFSLLQYTGDNPAPGMTELPDERTRHTLSLHRLVQEVIRHNLAQPVPNVRDADQAKEYRNGYLKRGILAISKAFPEGKYETWELCGRLLPHVLVCEQHMNNDGLDTEAVSQLLIRTATYLYYHAQFPKAEQLYEKALAMCKQVHGGEHEMTAVILNHLGVLYRDMGRYDEAEAQLKKALEIDRQRENADRGEYAIHLDNLASVYYLQHRNEEAILLYQEALEIAGMEPERNNRRIASCLNGLATAYSEEKRYTEAEKLLKEALDVSMQHLPTNYREYEITRFYLGRLYVQCGRLSEAELLLDQTLESCKRMLAPTHPYNAYPLHWLGRLRYEQKRFEEAERYLLEALKICEGALPPQHPGTVENRKWLVIVRAEM